MEAECLVRNAVPHAACTYAGRFVDVATGKVIVVHRDFALGTTDPLLFERTWLSTSTYSGPLGHGWHHAYDVALACRSDNVAIRLADGRVLWFSAPALGKDSFDSAEQLRLSRDTYGFALRDARGAELRFVPHRSQPAFVLSSLRGLSGIELRFGYDHRARLVRITSRGDRDLELAYDPTDRLTTVQGADPRHTGKRIILVQYAYDARGNLRKATDALGQARRYGYDRHLLTAAIDRGGCSAQFEWDGPDSRARCVHTWVDAGIRDRKLEYTERATLVRNAAGHRTSFEHDDSIVHRIVNTRGEVRELNRGEDWRVVREVDPLEGISVREFDARGHLAKLCEPDGARWSFERDERGRTQRVIDPLGRRWQFVHDARGRVLRSVDPLGRITRQHFRGRWLVGVTTPGDQHHRYAYDDLGNLESRTTPGGLVTSYAYDAWGQVVTIAFPNAKTQYRQYDVLGRLIRIGESDSNHCELAYDAEGRVVRWKDRQRDVKFTYQGTGQLSSRSEAGVTVCFEYDAEEQLVGIVNEQGKVFRLGRDVLGDIIEATGFDGCTRTYVRDALARITRVERGGQFSEYDYDSVGRVVEVQHSDGGFEGYRYRQDGALMGAWNQESSLVFEHDACARVTREQQGEHFVITHYDAADWRTGVESSLGLDLKFERDAAGRLRRILERRSGFETSFERDALGLVLERTLPDGHRCIWQRDALGRPCVVRHVDRSGTITREFCYEWDGIGRLRRWTDSRGGTAEYRYDPRGNLAWRKAGDGGYQLRMPDPLGNLFQREDRRDREYGLAGQLLVRSGQSGEVQSQFDASGNIIERRGPGDRVWRYAWSAAGLLRAVVRPNGDEVTFGYDALGRRIWKKHRGQTTRFVWDGSRLVHEWGEGESPVTWLYNPDSAHPIAKLTSSGVFAILTDHTGAPTQMLAQDGQQLWAAEISIHGEARAVEGSRHACLLRWPGMYEDLETGLYCEYTDQNGASRYYDPANGSYVCQGALAAAPNLRAYGHGYALGVEWADARTPPCPDLAESSVQRMAAERTPASAASAAASSPTCAQHQLYDAAAYASPLLPGTARVAHRWTAALRPSREFASLARASDTPARCSAERFVASDAVSWGVECEPRLAELAGEYIPTKSAPHARPLLFR